MQRLMDYAELNSIIESKLPLIKERGYDEIVAVVRGGLTAAHLLAKKLRLPVACYYPATSERDAILVKAKKSSTKLLFVEDLVALGRTYEGLTLFMSERSEEWDFFPILVDSGYQGTFMIEGIRSSDWVVFPYEDSAKVIEGDRGLFRDETDLYGVE